MRAFEPASVQKLTVALTALDRFGPGYRIPTNVLGDGTKTGATWDGRLVLKGYGDPTLTLAKMRTLALAIRASGIRTVTGRVIADESYYDTRRMCPGQSGLMSRLVGPPRSAPQGSACCTRPGSAKRRPARCGSPASIPPHSRSSSGR